MKQTKTVDVKKSHCPYCGAKSGALHRDRLLCGMMTVVDSFAPPGSPQEDELNAAYAELRGVKSGVPEITVIRSYVTGVLRALPKQSV